ncbi:SH3 domain-containing protein [Oscillatoria sp. FACHB-1407]|uniref:SH3 domain-containing protein n=1 Tax=Oscillatoria sp. FACHB-1407 TaxID=2692847 RepID=UPI001686FAF6|nr:SH3 domain-containing protein [Oscillatoria sp. FACHB-1407]MBD2465497.1 SH3 domain-containing protein [Oscillatoria sp. FACHB-1407]
MKGHKWNRIGVTAVALIASAISLQNHSAALAEPLLAQQEYQLAQIPDNCRQVTASSGLYVRQEPTVYSQALGVIGSGRYVTIKNPGTNGWAPISAPLEGYVYTGFLGTCQETTPPPSNCRRVQADEELLVRQEPSVNGTVVGTVTDGRRVTIANLGVNGWVPITVPLVGYVSSDYLAYCQ